jgi:hypothetical protein
LPQEKILSAETIPAGAFRLPVELPPFLADGAGVKVTPSHHAMRQSENGFFQNRTDEPTGE